MFSLGIGDVGQEIGAETHNRPHHLRRIRHIRPRDPREHGPGSIDDRHALVLSAHHELLERVPDRKRRQHLVHPRTVHPHLHRPPAVGERRVHAQPRPIPSPFQRIAVLREFPGPQHGQRAALGVPAAHGARDNPAGAIRDCNMVGYGFRAFPCRGQRTLDPVGQGFPGLVLAFRKRRQLGGKQRLQHHLILDALLDLRRQAHGVFDARRRHGRHHCSGAPVRHPHVEAENYEDHAGHHGDHEEHERGDGEIEPGTEPKRHQPPVS